MCTYKTYQWSVTQRKAVNRRTVKKPRSRLTADEKAPDFATSGCTVCREDQVEIKVGDLPTVRICKFYAPRVREALERVVADGSFRIEKLQGYRVGQTRGRVVDGKRTQFSNHSFGTALDVNAHRNALYRRCDLAGETPRKSADIKRCKRGIGGAWNPEEHPRTTITPDTVVYKLFTRHVGWKWGGEISGRIKDFMHFSPDGR